MNHISSYIIRNYLSWLPDKTYLRLLFLIETGKILHLANPRTFQEKIQWLKLFNKHNEYTQMVDKVSAKNMFPISLAKNILFQPSVFGKILMTSSSKNYPTNLY